MIDIRRLKMTDGRIEFEVYTGFGKWVEIEMYRVDIGVEHTGLEEALEDIDDETYYTIEEIIAGLTPFVEHVSVKE